MPASSSRSFVHTWPDRAQVETALRAWAVAAAASRPELLRVGYFGSYARDEWGVGSDLDVILIVRSCDLSFERRAAQWNLNSLPVPVDVLVYTPDEFGALAARGGRFCELLRAEVSWLS